jgi:hypothetical protein
VIELPSLDISDIEGFPFKILGSLVAQSIQSIYLLLADQCPNQNSLIFATQPEIE